MVERRLSLKNESKWHIISDRRLGSQKDSTSYTLNFQKESAGLWKRCWDRKTWLRSDEHSRETEAPGVMETFGSKIRKDRREAEGRAQRKAFITAPVPLPASCPSSSSTCSILVDQMTKAFGPLCSARTFIPGSALCDLTTEANGSTKLLLPRVAQKSWCHNLVHGLSSSPQICMLKS